MPSTRHSLAILSLIALVGLSGCQGTLLSRPADDSGSLSARSIGKPDAVVQAEGQWKASNPDGLASATGSAPADHADLWDRVRQGFRLSQPDNPRIEKQLKWYHDHPEHLPRIEQRARLYLYYVVEALQERDLPMELALLPVIESGYRPGAQSSRRAAGIWQIMPATGKMLGLKQNWWYDGRRDVLAATGAALDYLEYLAAQFDGDWELTLAAYNSGEGTVNRAIRKNRKHGKPEDYWSLDLPRETERYVPRLLALARVIENPDAFGTRLTDIPNQPFFDNVDIETQLDLRLAAEMAGLPVDDLYRLNPGFKRWATAPQGPHRLVLPLNSIEQFQQKLAALDPDKRLRWSRYIIQPGDNLGSIARRHGTTVAALKQSNGLKSSRIRAGKHLLIPESRQIADGRPASAVRKQHPVELAGNKTLYTIRSGDSLWMIARNHKVSHRSLAKWNGISVRETLQPGRQLVVYHPNGESGHPVSSKKVRSLSYSVRKGDTLSSIAARFNVRVADLKQWNHLPGKYLQPGQNLNLYLKLADQSI